MARFWFSRPLGALITAFCFAVGVAAAQAPASSKGADESREQQNRQISQPLNNAPVWKEIRSGIPQTTTVTGPEANVLMQSGGQTWRAVRAPIAFWGGLLFALAVAGLAVFYMIRGTMTVESQPGQRVIQRFTPADRMAHGLLAIVWVTLAITGLILSLGKGVLLPLIGYTLFSWLAALAKNLHNFIGPILMIAVPWMFIRFVRDNGISAEDFKWFAHILDYFKGHEYPSGKFNAGEKSVFWLLLVGLSTVLIVSGLVLVFPNFGQDRSTMQWANAIHMVAAFLAISFALVHIYLGTVGLAGSYRAIRYGYVDASWAQHHHVRWYEDVVAGRAREQFVGPPPPAAADVRAPHQHYPA